MPGDVDAIEDRKARGAYFTPSGITTHIAEWAIRSPRDRIFEPSAGEAAFLTAAVRQLRALGNKQPEVHGVEIHEPSAQAARSLVEAAGGIARLEVADFFLAGGSEKYTVVIGNPPFVRYQDFRGNSRSRAREAALRQGVALSGLASSWAPFVVHSAAHLEPGGRLGLVLPAELLSVNYAAPVRRFLLENFAAVELVVFEEQVFPDAEADTVLVKATGWQERPAGAATLRQTRNASTLDHLTPPVSWEPADAAERWSAIPLRSESTEKLAELRQEEQFVPLGSYGATRLGAVTGSNHFFTLSPARVKELGIPTRDLVPVSPPGSAHLRQLELTSQELRRLGESGAATWLLNPSARPSEATMRYIESGHQTGVDSAYKCRMRSPWWRVPLLAPADLLLTYMNADTPRLTTNSARALHLNSVHGVYLAEHLRELAADVLPIASLNSVTLLSAELAGRSYGGGILKLEPREADKWLLPSPTILETNREALGHLKQEVKPLLAARRLEDAVALVDQVVLSSLIGEASQNALRADRTALTNRRMLRGRSGRSK